MVNIAVLEGRITATPELKHTPNDIPMTRFSIAVARNYSKGGERLTDFFDVVAWRNTAEFVCKYFKKGNPMIVDGQIQMDIFEGRDGIKRKSFYIVANNVHFVGSKADNVALDTEKADTKNENSSEGYSTDASFNQEFSDNETSSEVDVNSDNETSSEVDVNDDDLPF